MLLCDRVSTVIMLNIWGGIKDVELWSGWHSTFHAVGLVYVWHIWGGKVLVLSFLYTAMHFV